MSYAFYDDHRLSFKLVIHLMVIVLNKIYIHIIFGVLNRADCVMLFVLFPIGLVK